MATRGIAMTIAYVAWDTNANAGKTGDEANHTLRWIKDGTSAAPTNAPTEVDATNAPGLYKIALTATETDCDIGVLCGKSSTSNVSIIPVTIQFERLPNAAPGASGGLPIIGSEPLTYLNEHISNVGNIVWNHGPRSLTNVVQLDMDQVVEVRNSGSVGDRLQQAGRLPSIQFKTDQLQFGSGSRVLAEVSSAAVATAVWDAERASHTTEGTFGATGEWAGGGGGGATAEQVWSYPTRSLTAAVNVNMSQVLPASPTSDTIGEALKYAATRLDVGVSSRASASDYTAARAAKLDHLNADITTRAPAATALSNTTWTDARAAALDNLDAAITSRAAAATALSNAIWTNARAANLDNLDAAISTRAPAATALSNATWSDVRAARLDNLDATITSRLAAAAYVAPDNSGIAAIKAKTDKLTFNASNQVFAVCDGGGGGGGGGGSVQVVVQPLSVRVFEPTGDGGMITMWRYARARAAWYVNADLRSRELVWLAYAQTDPNVAASQCTSAAGEITVEWQDTYSRSYVSLDAAEAKVPAPGTYRYVLRDQTTDTVLLSGTLVVRAAPNTS